MSNRERGHGEGSILTRKRADGSERHRLRYRVGAKRHSIEFRGSLTEARKELRRLLKSADDGLHVAPDKMTLAQWGDKWLALLERREEGEDKVWRKRGLVGARTSERYAELKRLHLEPKLGKKVLQKITASEIDELYVELEKKLQPLTVRQIHVVLHSMLAMAVRKGLIQNNPAALAEPPAIGERKVGRVLEQTELDGLLNGFKGTAIYPVICVAAYTGARRNEILALQWSDVDFERRSLTIARAIDETKKHGRGLKEPKTERGKRTITLDDGLLTLLRSEREKHLRIMAGVPDGAPVNISLVKLPKDSLVFPAAPAKGEGFSFSKLRNPRGVTKEFQRHAVKIGKTIGNDFAGLRFHDLRGTHGTLLLNAGVSVATVAARLGHDPAVLLHSYAKRTKKGDTTAAEIIGALSRNVLG